MKKKGLVFILISLFIWIVSACGTNSSSKLDKAIHSLEIKESSGKINQDFYVPKTLEYENSYYTITWTADLKEVTIKEENQLIIVDIDFDALSKGLHTLILKATIQEDSTSAYKTFNVILTKDNNSEDTPGSDTPGSDTPGSDTPGSDTPGSDTPGSDTPGSDTPGSDTPGSDTPGSDTPGSDTPGSDTPGSDTPGSDTPGSDTPGSDTPGGDTPSDNELSFTKKEFTNRLGEDGPLTEEAFPSIGSPKMLVIPVNLKDSEKTPKNILDIKKAFTGTSTSTGWESVQSYYAKSSYNKLNMDIKVLSEWFTPKHSVTYYESYSSNDEDGSVVILREALEHYNNTIDFSEYDNDKDGYIDGVWLVYNYDVDFVSENTLFWAFTSWNFQEDEYDGVKSYYYAWAGIDFLHPTKEEASFYDPTNIKVDAHTFIHETGHMLGLDDYYDYDEKSGANSLGFYGADMMDYNIGDHCAISKLLLGWVTPTLVQGTGTGTIDLKSFTTSGEFLIIADHTLSSIYDTYWIIEFYTNDGLNAQDKPYDSTTAPYGIRILEIHAEKNLVDGNVENNTGTYQTGFKYDNSDESKMFVDVVYDKTPESLNDYSLDADCLYQSGETMNKTGLPFELVVNTMTKDSANITITVK